MERTFSLNEHTINSKKFPTNFISTRHYTSLNFLPKNLFFQFRRLANVYFLIVALVQMVFDVSDSWMGKYSTFAIFLMVLGFVALREAVEDSKRHFSDSELNNRMTKVLRGEKFLETKWKDVVVGDIVRVEGGSWIPADMIMLSPLIADMQTSNLDGETSFKPKRGIKVTADILKPSDLAQISGKISCIREVKRNGVVTCTLHLTELPSSHRNLFFQADSKSSRFLIQNINLLLRGGQLRNAKFAVGVVIFTGHDCELHKKSSKSPVFKRTEIEKELDFSLLFLCAIVFCVALVATFAQNLMETHTFKDVWYLDIEETKLFSSFLSYLILFNNVVPISLYVLLEFVRFTQAHFVKTDKDMCDENLGKPLVRTISLMEDLGRVQHIFTDKTGTLTQNDLKLSMIYVKSTKSRFGYAPPQISLYSTKSPNHSDGTELTLSRDYSSSSVRDERYIGEIARTQTQSPISENPELLKYLRCDSGTSDFLFSISLCHNVVGNEVYESSSPDEVALVTFAREMNYKFRSRFSGERVVSVFENDSVIQLLAMNEFTSDRKRMSVVCKLPNNKVRLFCKGADEIMLKLCVETDEEKAEITKQTDYFASKGLRTLVFAYRDITEFELVFWKKRYDHAFEKQNLVALSILAAEIEVGMHCLGVTAIEDRLQENVPIVIDKLLCAGMKVWMLTGDKVDTAISIARSCNLLRPEMHLVHLHDIARNHVDELDEKLSEIELNSNQKLLALVIDGSFLSEIFEEENIIQLNLDRSARVFSIGNYERYSRRNGTKSNSKSNSFFNSLVETQLNSKLLVEEIYPQIQKDQKYYTTLQEKFMTLLSHCSSVIVCRSSPAQKAMMVKLVNNQCVPNSLKKSSPVTLAIGDGSNDAAMLREARLGVAIMGKEGTEAVLACDYAIAKFEDLGRLLLLHGRWTDRRTTKFLSYSLYKSSLTFFALLGFLYHCGFSGTHLLGTTEQLTFNAFTALPALAIGAFHQDVSEEIAFSYPTTFRFGIKRLSYRWSMNLSLRALIQVVVILGMTLSLRALFGYFAPGEDIGLGFEGYSTYIYTLIIITVFMDAFFRSKYCYLPLIIASILSFFSWVLFLFMSSYLAQTNIIGSNYELYSVEYPLFWCDALLVPFTAMIPQILFRLAYKQPQYHSQLTKLLQQ